MKLYNKILFCFPIRFIIFTGIFELYKILKNKYYNVLNNDIFLSIYKILINRVYCEHLLKIIRTKYKCVVHVNAFSL